MKESEQERAWEEISLSVSNLRLMDRSCRRPLVRHLCLEAFGSCLYPSLFVFFVFLFYFFIFVLFCFVLFFLIFVWMEKLFFFFFFFFFFFVFCFLFFCFFVFDSFFFFFFFFPFFFLLFSSSLSLFPLLHPDITNYLQYEWSTLCETCELAISLLSPPGNCSLSPPPPPPSDDYFPFDDDEPIPVLTCLSENYEDSKTFHFHFHFNFFSSSLSFSFSFFFTFISIFLLLHFNPISFFFPHIFPPLSFTSPFPPLSPSQSNAAQTPSKDLMMENVVLLVNII